MRRLALTLLALLLAACSHPSGRAREAPPAAPPTPEQTAHTLNQAMFDAMQLPRGAQLIHGPLPAILTSRNNVPGMGDPFLGNLVDDYRTWSVPLPVRTVRNFNFTPVRNGFDGPGTSSGGRLKTSDSTEWLGGSTYSKLPLNVALAELNTAVTDDGHGGSVIRADALSSWTPPKTKAELVPTDDHVARITVMAADSPPNVVRRVSVTDPKQFATIATAFDRLRLAPIVLGGECGSLNVEIPGLGAYARGTMVTEVAFSRDRRSGPNLLVWTPTCHGIGVRANGKLQPTLAGDFASTVRNAMLAES